MEDFVSTLYEEAKLDTIFLTNIYKLVLQMKKTQEIKKEIGLENSNELQGEDNSYQAAHLSEKILERKKLFPALAAKNDPELAKQLMAPDSQVKSENSTRPSESKDVLDMMSQLESLQQEAKIEKKEEKSSRKRKRRDGSYREKGKYEDDDSEPMPGKIYKGRVTNLKVFGAFVFLKGIKGKNEGLIHLTELSNKRIQDPEQIVQRNCEVFVKVLSVTGKRISLSFKDACQKTGMDLDPERMQRRKDLRDERKEKQDKYMMEQSSHETMTAKRKKKIYGVSDMERWEHKQMHMGSVLDRALLQDFDETGGILADDPDSDAEDLEIDIIDED